MQVKANFELHSAGMQFKIDLMRSVTHAENRSKI